MKSNFGEFLMKVLVVLLLMLMCFSQKRSLFSQELFEAVNSNKLEIIESILLKNPEAVKRTDSDGNTALHIASLSGYLDIVKILIKYNADPNSLNRFEFSPLHYATQENDIEISNLLISNGAEINHILMDTYYGYTPLTFSIMNNNLELLKLLFSKGGHIQHRTSLGESYLHFASAFNAVEIADFLINNELDVNSKKDGGLTPLHIASLIGNFEMTEFLISKGADLDMRSNDGGTAFHYAIASKNVETANLLSKSGSKDLPRNFSDYYGKHLGQEEPGNEPEPFAPELFRDLYRSYSVPVFSPDRKELFWYCYLMPWIGYARIWRMKEENGKWTPPELASFSDYHSWGPSFSPDGMRLYFASRRPNGNRSDADIWYVEKKENGWSEPINPGTPPNRPDYNEMRPVVSRDGALYFIAFGSESYGTRCYKSDLTEGLYNAPQPLEEFIDNKIKDDCLDIQYLILYSYFSKNYADIFISFHKPDGSWSVPVHMGEKVHNGHGTSQGLISPDGKVFFYNQDISPYWIDASFIQNLKED